MGNRPLPKVTLCCAWSAHRAPTSTDTPRPSPPQMQLIGGGGAAFSLTFGGPRIPGCSWWQGTSLKVKYGAPICKRRNGGWAQLSPVKTHTWRRRDAVSGPPLWTPGGHWLTGLTLSLASEKQHNLNASQSTGGSACPLALPPPSWGLANCHSLVTAKEM